MSKNKSLYSIRKKKHTKHPFVIVGYNKTKFKAMGITHSKKSGHRNNFKLNNNPNKKDKRETYLKRQVIEDFKFNFSKAFKDYKLSDSDINNLINYLENKKKK